MYHTIGLDSVSSDSGEMNGTHQDLEVSPVHKVLSPTLDSRKICKVQVNMYRPSVLSVYILHEHAQPEGMKPTCQTYQH